MQHVTIKETRAIDHVLVNRLEKEVQELRAKLRMQSAQLQNCTSAGVSAAGAAPALASSMSSPQLGPATTSAQQHQRADPAAAAAAAAAAGAPASPHVVVKTVASSQVLEELAQYRKRCASLESILEAIDKCANRFFRFEIEEDEMETEMVGHLRKAKVIRKKRIDSMVPTESLPASSSASSLGARAHPPLLESPRVVGQSRLCQD